MSICLFQFELQRIKLDIQRVQRLINIVKPIELPPLKCEQTATDASKSKKNLPLFGKKKSFGFEKLKLQVATKQPSSSNQNEADATDTIEEFDDDDDANANKTNEKTSKIANSNAETISIAVESIKSIDEGNNCELKSTQELQCTKEIPPTTKEKRKENKKIHEHSESININEQHDSTNNSLSNVNASTEGSGSSSRAANDKKSKNRHRNKTRHHIDIDDTEEDTSPQKFSSWMPPENQTGDGITELNSKYGY